MGRLNDSTQDGDSMIRVLMMANDSLLADGIGSLLAQEINLDVVRITQQELGKGDPHSVLLVIDEGQSVNESIKVADLFRGHGNCIVIMVSLESRNIYIYESYQLDNPDMEQVVHIIKEFSRMNLKKNPDEHLLTKTSLSPWKDFTSSLFSFSFLHVLGRKRVRNVTPAINHFSGFDL
jgi:hypothetical protein